MRLRVRAVAVALAVAAAVLAPPTNAMAVIVLSDAGPDIASITDTVNLFRAALGEPNNGNNPGPLPSGRREINWDGAAIPPTFDGTAPVTPFLTFQGTRGATFTTLGTGLTQAAATGGLLSLDLINPQYAQLFAPFSPNRLFAPIGVNLTDGFFTIPNSAGGVPAGVSGFGVVFSDVDLPVTSISLTNDRGEPLGVFFVPTFPGNQTFSFLGLLTEPGDGLIASMDIITGTTPLGPSESPTTDLVVMDDFFYGEPQGLQGVGVPQPRSLLFLGLGLVVVSSVVWARRSRSTRSSSSM
jgi:hypothetical protein